VAALLVGVLLGAALVGCSSSDPHPSAGQLSAYEQAILPTVRDWGSVEVEGIQPAINDLRSGTGVPAVAIVTEASAWQGALRLDRTKLQAVHAPAGLTGCATLFDQAIVKYIAAAATFGRAASTPPGAARISLIDTGVATAKEGDQLYNQASAIIQAAHRRLGQSPTPDFPNK
jgi:hypothetical protein